MKLSLGLLIALISSAAASIQYNYHPLAAYQQIVTFLDHSNCNRFYIVLDQLAIEVGCPAKQYWNSYKQSCDSICVRGEARKVRKRRSTLAFSLFDISEVVNQVDLQSSDSTVEDVTSYRSPVIPVTTRPDHIRCPSAKNYGRVPPTYYSHEQDCSKYYECVGETAMEKHCPPLRFWNQQDKYCGSECIN